MHFQEFHTFASALLCEGDLWHRLKNEKAPLWIYGTGNGADKLCQRLERLGIPYCGFFASDDFVRGQSFRGMQVRRFSDVLEKFPSAIALLAFGTRLPNVISDIEKLARRITLLVPDLPVAGEVYFDGKFLGENLPYFSQVDALWANASSRFLYREMIAGKLQGGLDRILNAYSSREETPYFSLNSGDTIVDAGAYNGDTVREMHRIWPAVRDFLAIEPDPKNYKKLCAFCEGEERELRVEAIHAAVGNIDGECLFYSGGNRNSTKTASSHETKTISIPQVKIDTLSQGRNIKMIKFDVEGAEEEALLGGRETIKRCRPAMKIAIYHRSADLFQIPLLCSTLCQDYRFYLCRNKCLPVWEADLYAIPKEMENL